MIRILLLVVMLGGGTALAQQKLPIPRPLLQAETLPRPPQQDAPWSHGKDAFSNAAATLFEQGLPDPRGLDYREIEIAVGSPWNGGGYPVITHGWVLPRNDQDGRFAIAWNGLIYPVLRVGAVADLRKDWAPGSKMAQIQNQGFNTVAEQFTVSFDSPGVLKLVLLARLGQSEIIQRVLKSSGYQGKPDPYLDLARDWAWNAFERAVCAHQRGDDYLALADARLLTRIQPLVEAEAKRRGFKPDSDDSNSRFPDRNLPYLPFLRQLPALLADSERRVAHQKSSSRPETSIVAKTDAAATNGVAATNDVTTTADIATLIEDLENVNERQTGQPGGVSLASDARVAALVQRGNDAVEPLLKAYESDERLTRSVSFHRNFGRSRHLISVSEAAYAAMLDILRVQLKPSNENGEPLSKTEMAAQIRAYWAKMGDLSPAERFYVTLKDDQAGKDQWLQAAANIVQPTDVERHGNWTTTPQREPGQIIVPRGESLRDGRTPSVSDLLARRSDNIAAIRTQSSRDKFLFVDACAMALHLAAWDKTAALPVLKRRLARAWNIGQEKDDILAFNGDPVEAFGKAIAHMTLARARGGDETAYDEYAAWIQKVDLSGMSFGGEELQKPLIEGVARPSIGRALDYLFNDPQSSWSDILGERNGFWLHEFLQSPLPQTAGFRKQALRALANKHPAGTITFNPREDWNSRMEAQIQIKGLGMGFRGSDNDPDTPPPGVKRSFRVCDAYAYFYSQFQGGPKFQLFWPEKKRDAGVVACRLWLEAKR